MINHYYFLNITKLVYVLPHTAACNICPVHASQTEKPKVQGSQVYHVRFL